MISSTETARVHNTHGLGNNGPERSCEVAVTIDVERLAVLIGGIPA